MQVDFEDSRDSQAKKLKKPASERDRESGLARDLSTSTTSDTDEHRHREWPRKSPRWCLLTGNGEPWVWDFGSAARHHRIYAPWLPKNHCLAGLTGLRGAVSPKVGLFEQMAQEVYDILKEEGVADMPIGVDVVEPPFLFALQKLGLEVRDGQQTMLDARELKSHDEITLLNMGRAGRRGVQGKSSKRQTASR